MSTENAEVLVFGATQEAFKIESDKAFAKSLMHEYGIPTSDYRVFGEARSGLAHGWLDEVTEAIHLKEKADFYRDMLDDAEGKLQTKLSKMHKDSELLKPVVLKYNGLAQGKGVVVCKTLDELLEGWKVMRGLIIKNTEGIGV